MIYMETRSTDPYYNLAFEEYMLTHSSGEDILILWQNESTVVVGLNQNTAEEINIPYAEANGIHIVRRGTGGGAVYHDLGNLNYSLISDISRQEDPSIAHFSNAVCRVLRNLGVPALAGGKNDITVDGKKVSGAAQRLYGDRLLHHGCILFNADLGMISRVLAPGKLKYSSKSIKSVSARVANISDFLNSPLSLEDFWRELVLGMGADPADSRSALSPAMEEEIEALAENKYRTREWNFGHCPDYTVSGEERFHGGVLEFRAKVEAGRIISCSFHGDYMAMADSGALCSALSGVWFRKQDVAGVLDRFSMEELFGSISREQLLGLMFPDA